MLGSIHSLKERVTPETGLLVIFLVTATYMFVESFVFAREVALFPRFAAFVTMIGAALLLARNYLPERLREAVADSSGVFDHYAAEDTDGDDDAVEMGMGTAADEDMQTKKQVILVGLIVVYGILGYLIGLVWATPIFILAFAVVFKLPLVMTLLLPILGLLIAIAFNLILPTDIGAGVLL